MNIFQRDRILKEYFHCDVAIIINLYLCHPDIDEIQNVSYINRMVKAYEERRHFLLCKFQTDDLRLHLSKYNKYPELKHLLTTIKYIYVHDNRLNTRSDKKYRIEINNVILHVQAKDFTHNLCLQMWYCYDDVYYNYCPDDVKLYDIMNVQHITRGLCHNFINDIFLYTMTIYKKRNFI